MKNFKHPGVSIVLCGSLWQLSFKHPLKGYAQIKRSVRTTDRNVAENYARELSQILQRPADWRKLPEGTSEAVKGLWEGGGILGDSAKLAIQSALTTAKYHPFGRGGSIAAFATAAPLAANANGKIDELQSIIDGLRADNAALSMRVDQLAGLLNKAGIQAARELAPKLLQDSINDYLSDDKKLSGTNAAPRKKGIYRSWFERFANNLPQGTMTTDVTHKMITDHLADCAAGKFATGKGRKGMKCSPETVKEIGKHIACWLTKETSGMFRGQPIYDWVAKNFFNSNEPAEIPYWLDEKQVEMLLAEMPQYWRDVAFIQNMGGFRPEELPRIQFRDCFVNGDIRIAISVLKNDKGETVWTAKTPKSYGRVHLPEEARETMRRLLSEPRTMLFQNSTATGYCCKWPANSWEAINKVWRAEAFCEMYLSALRIAIDEANKKGAGIEKDKFDGRTLRRTCGKRVLINSNYNMELAAAILRDHPLTVRKHYACIIPSDVQQPEKKAGK